jgi:cardiolipin synthase
MKKEPLKIAPQPIRKNRLPSVTRRVRVSELKRHFAAPLFWLENALLNGKEWLRGVRLGVWRGGHEITLLSSGQTFFDSLCREIECAQSEILFETYIFKLDRAGQRVALALEAAAQRGVAVFMRLDGFGSADFTPDWRVRLERAGATVQMFNPPRWYSWFYFRYWRRLHRKLVVVDSRVAFCGGMNIIDDYYDDNIGRLPSPRLDFTVRVCGPLVQDVRSLMWGASLGVEADAQQEATEPAEGVQAAFVVRDNVRYRRRIESVYLRAIARAKTDIVIANAYFVPGYRLRHALLDAVKRGVRVTLLVQGLYEGFMSYHASQAVLGALLRGGVRVVRYEASHYHGKVAVVDGRWATVGSSNLDPISLLLAKEANVMVDDEGFASLLCEKIDAAMVQGGREMTLQELGQRTLVKRLGDWVAYAVMNVLIVASGNRFHR